jgi:hypothetical protein
VEVAACTVEAEVVLLRAAVAMAAETALALMVVVAREAEMVEAA